MEIRGLGYLFRTRRTVVTLCLAAAIGACSESICQTAASLDVKPAAFGLFSPIDADDSMTINASFMSDGNTVYFSKSHAGWAGLTIFESHRKADQWSEPEVAAFSGVYRDTDPAVAPDGKSIVFASMRDKDGHAAKTYSLFRVLLTEDGANRVTAFGTAVNDGANELYPSLARDGTLYFVRSQGITARIVRAVPQGDQYVSAEVQRIPGDTDKVFDSDPTISPDQSFLVFSSNRPDSLGSNDLYVSFRRAGQWCQPLHLDAPINSPGPEIATGLSPDSRHLFFASARNTLVQPRANRVTAKTFRSEMSGYQNGVMRTYEVDLGAWLDSHRPPPDSCEAH